MNSLTLDIHQDAWTSLREKVTEILTIIKNWEEIGDTEDQASDDEDEPELVNSDDPDADFIFRDIAQDIDGQGPYDDPDVEAINNLTIEAKLAELEEDALYEEIYFPHKEIYFPHELRGRLRSINNKLTAKDVIGLRSDFDELAAVCEEMNINVEEEYEEIEAYLDILDVYDGKIIYVPKRDVIYRPGLILEVHGELIKMIARNPEMIFKITPRKFEEIIAELFFKRGFEIELTKTTRDGGRDIVAIYEHMNVKTKYLIECKRYARMNKVSIGIVQRLLGVKVAESANKAILATTSTFTRDARNFANNHLWDLDLKDYNDIIKWIKAYR